MVLYTPLHYDEIFPTVEDMHEIKMYAGRQCYVKKHADGSFEIVRILSTNPADFLDPLIQPGTMIHH